MIEPERVSHMYMVQLGFQQKSLSGSSFNTNFLTLTVPVGKEGNMEDGTRGAEGQRCQASLAGKQHVLSLPGAGGDDSSGSEPLWPSQLGHWCTG